MKSSVIISKSLHKNDKRVHNSAYLSLMRQSSQSIQAFGGKKASTPRGTLLILFLCEATKNLRAGNDHRASEAELGPIVSLFGLTILEHHPLQQAILKRANLKYLQDDLRRGASSNIRSQPL